ncbi:CAP domain-containing protein [Vararia minispora EC-137]|uniref:CAP domain-containing protein n=1 Tax=Vararia minispora EC-137 TaxID=1314806 RepID=A0ACB8QLV2_9AGAM|nr:CAP domain-containing protein [Vararia minispora EC-137]
MDLHNLRGRRWYSDSFVNAISIDALTFNYVCWRMAGNENTILSHRSRALEGVKNMRLGGIYTSSISSEALRTFASFLCTLSIHITMSALFVSSALANILYRASLSRYHLSFLSFIWCIFFLSASVPPVVAIQASAKQQFLYAHNLARARHHAPPLVWDESLYAKAQSRANKCIFAHLGGGGENLAAAPPGETIPGAVALWMSEARDYDPHRPTYSHFTQVVWKDTTHLGCAVAHCHDILPSLPGLSYFYVCEYSPPGNLMNYDQFQKNVH